MHEYSAFPEIIVDHEDIDGIPPELYDYREDFGGKSWVDIKPELYNIHSDALQLMDFRSLVYFIAGFLKSAEEDAHGNGCESLLFFASTKRFKEFCSYLSKSQLRLICIKIKYLAENNNYCDDDTRLRVIYNIEWIMDTYNLL